MTRWRKIYHGDGTTTVITGDDKGPLKSRGPSLIRDEMSPTWHPATGEILDSKSEFRKRTRAAGCVEIGNEPMKDRRETSVRALGPDIARAIDQLSHR